MIDNILSVMKKEYRMKAVDAGVFKKLVIQGMDFAVECYDAVGLGRVSTMRASGLFGLVKRDMLIISPLEKEAPIVTYERVKAFGKDTFILYKNDLVNPEECTKKGGRKKQSADFDKEVEEYMQAYLKELASANECAASQRKKAVYDLVEVFIAGNRVSSDIFMATYGPKITEKLYHNFMFGTK